jgi:hypothetical protein
MNPNYLRPIQEAWSAIPAGPNSVVVPSSRAELGRLEALLPPGTRFPEALETYLLWAGDKAGNLYRLVDFSTHMISIYLENGLRSIQSMVKRSGGTDPLPADMLIINEHLGSNITYILLSEGDNPPVYFWEEGGTDGLGDAVQESQTFVEWVLVNIEAYRKTLR